MTSIGILEFLSDDSFRADGIATAIVMLIRDGAELGELSEVDIPNGDGSFRKGRAVPPVWLQRLVRAAEVGAFERMSVRAIVDRILEPPLPE